MTTVPAPRIAIDLIPKQELVLAQMGELFPPANILNNNETGAL